MPEPGTTPAVCGFRHDEWDGPYRMPRRCTAPAGHSDGQFAYDHGPWECLPLGWSDQPADGTTPGTSGRTETGATIANPQAAGADEGDTGVVGARVYQAKPAQAIQWHGESNCEQVFAFLGWEHPDDELDHTVICLDNDTDDEAHPRDWIVRDARGSYRALTESEFSGTYELVGGGQ